MTGYIYAVECGGRIKIGYSTKPEFRFSKISSDAPFPCTFLGQWMGTKEDESALHERFASSRCYREWFAATEEIKAFLSLNATKELPSRRYDVRQDDSVITAWRKERRIRQSDLAAQLGIDKSVYSRLEKGEIPAKHVRKLARVTGLPPAVLRPDLYAGMAAAE